MEGNHVRFFIRYDPLVRHIRVRYPDFWSDLGDLCEGEQAARITTRGAVVREFPDTHTIRIQIEPPRTRSVGVMAECLPLRRNAGQQTNEYMLSRECWNCGGGHRYTQCLLLRQQFCFGCGQTGETVRTCPRCGPEYMEGALFQEGQDSRDRSLGRRFFTADLPRSAESSGRQTKDERPGRDRSLGRRGSLSPIRSRCIGRGSWLIRELLAPRPGLARAEDAVRSPSHKAGERPCGRGRTFAPRTS
jgi:hypothetical protein